MFADSQGFDCYLGMQVWLADDENEIHILSEKNVVNLYGVRRWAHFTFIIIITNYNNARLNLQW